MKKSKNWFQKIKTSKIGIYFSKSSLKTLSFVGLFLFMTFLNVYLILTIVQLQYENADLKEEMFDYQNENKVIKERLEKVGTDQYIEEKAREHLGMVKSGETPIRVIEKEDMLEQGKTTLEANDKIGIYMEDWYIKLEDWLSYLKKKY